ncbi:hypothetical protein [Paracerasibacillus soli]|uniref:CPBP family intramembrane metalloprotease n=1 Tax=Paracerasibacillus soli TaxID=480284 RepID=A0ABU5CYL1_9BACI|nr:hypothetical protein [Virgibacillus soli]MDY0410498.1 hypothetical protein [Virgibacillus soli]
MKKNRWHLSEWIVGICILSYVITIYIYSNLHLDRTDVVIVFSIVTGLISSVWLYRTYRVVSNKQKYVWLLFFLAITSQILSNIIWLLVRTFTKTTQYPIVSSFFWVLSFPLFLYALYYLLKLINNAMIRKGFFFNTVIFICVATTISLHYLITPIIMVSSSSFILALNLVYPISDLGIMLFIVGLFFLSSYTNAKNIIRMITTAFFIHIVADSIYAYLLSEGESIPGGTADLLWIVAVLLLGLTGYKVTEKEIST